MNFFSLISKQLKNNFVYRLFFSFAWVYLRATNKKHHTMAKEDNLQFYALARKVRHENAALIAAGVTINELLKAIYQEETGQSDFRTLKDWNKDGQRVKKGEKCFRLFSRPANTIKEEKGQQPGEEDTGRFFVVKLFHAGQVQPATKKETI